MFFRVSRGDEIWAVTVHDRFGLDEGACRRFLQAFAGHGVASDDPGFSTRLAGEFTREFRCEAAAAARRQPDGAYALEIGPQHDRWPYQDRVVVTPGSSVNCSAEWEHLAGCRRGLVGWSAPFASTARALGFPAPKRRETGLRHLCAKPREHQNDHVCHCGVYSRSSS
jgi:hypothetical protein